MASAEAGQSNCKENSHPRTMSPNGVEDTGSERCSKDFDNLFKSGQKNDPNMGDFFKASSIVEVEPGANHTLMGPLKHFLSSLTSS